MFHTLLHSNTPLQFATTYMNIIAPLTNDIANILQTTVQLFWQLRSSFIQHSQTPFHASSFDNHQLTLHHRSNLTALIAEATFAKLSNTSEEITNKHIILLRRNILHQLKPSQHLREVEVYTPSSPQLFFRFSQSFHKYDPLKLLKDTTEYTKTTNMDSIHKFLGVEALNRRYLFPNANHTGYDELDITVEASEHRPFRALYNPVKQQMLLSFYYFPNPRAAWWRPTWRADIKKKDNVNWAIVQVCCFLFKLSYCILCLLIIVF